MAGHATYLGAGRQAGGVPERGVYELSHYADGYSAVPVLRGAAEAGRQGGRNIPKGSPSADQTLRCGPGQQSRPHPPSQVVD